MYIRLIQRTSYEQNGHMIHTTNKPYAVQARLRKIHIAKRMHELAKVAVTEPHLTSIMGAIVNPAYPGHVSNVP